MKYKHWIRRFAILTSILFFSCICAVVVFWIYIRIAGAPDLKVHQTTLYYGDKGEIIGEVSRGQKRLWVPINEISPLFIEAIIATEDKSFFEHGGIDLKRIGGAIWADIKAGKKKQGASTISQQYARNLFLSTEKSWKRKITEIVYALRIEANYSKEEILEGYINTIYFGHGMYGVEAASEFYFHKTAGELTLAEIAILAGLPKGPSIYSPLINKENSKNRKQYVLNNLFNMHKITAEDFQSSLNEEVICYGTNMSLSEPIAPYFLSEAKKEVIKIFKNKPEILKQGGLRIYTTLNVFAQTTAEQVVAETLPKNSELQTAIVTMEPQSGKVKVLIGGRDFSKSPFNRATQGMRQPGSTVKPLLYYGALEKGFTPATTMRSEATSFILESGKTKYEPHNFNNLYANRDVTLMQALAVSDNVFAVKTHLFLGEDVLAEMGHKFGIKSQLEKVPSAALGTSLVHPIEITNAFNYFANNGKKVAPFYIEKITDYKGRVLYTHKTKEEQVLDAVQTFVMSQMLKGTFDPRLSDYATVTGNSILNLLTHDYAGKSGSTSTDSWMIGFSPRFTTGVWVGYDNGQNFKTNIEIGYSKLLWANIMEKEHENISEIKEFVPTNVVGVEIDPTTGFLATRSCKNTRLTYFARGTEPTKACPEHAGKNIDEVPITNKKKKNAEKSWFKKLLPW